MENQFCHFYFFELWSILFTISKCIYRPKWKDAQFSETDFWVHDFFLRFLFFELWSILYFTFVIHSELRRIQKYIYAKGALTPRFGGRLRLRYPLWGLCPQTPDAFGLNPPSHWLAYKSGSLNLVSESPVNHCWIQNRPYLKNWK